MPEVKVSCKGWPDEIFIASNAAELWESAERAFGLGRLTMSREDGTRVTVARDATFSIVTGSEFNWIIAGGHLLHITC
jgi:hypothetical protein